VAPETGGKIRLTIDTAQDLGLIADEATVDKQLKIRTNLASYTDRKHYTDVTVTISAATCDCQYLLWTDVPHPSAVTATISVESPDDVTLATPTPDPTTNLSEYAAF
jgi:hypothetical protein